MCTRRSAGGEIEAEPVKVDVTGRAVELVLDDGESLEFDTRELVAAIEIEAVGEITARDAA